MKSGVVSYKLRFIGIKLCKSTEKYNITILHENPDMVDNCWVVMMFLHGIALSVDNS